MNNKFHHGRRGRNSLYTDQTISTFQIFLMFKGIFSLTLRATQGRLDSLFELMNVPLCAPDYSYVSKQARTVKVTYRRPIKGRITTLADAILDRLMHNAHRLSLKGESMRKRRSELTQSEQSS
jgi:hypothetical protein